MRLGIVAPGAAQGAAGEEDGGSNAGAVMGGESFDEYSPRRSCGHMRSGVAGELPVLEGGHADGGLELAAEGRLIAEPTIECDHAERVVGLAQARGGGFDADAGEQLARGNLELGAHEAFETAERKFGLADDFTDAQRFIVVLVHVVDGPSQLAEVGTFVHRGAQVAGDGGDGDDVAFEIPERNLV